MRRTCRSELGTVTFSLRDPDNILPKWLGLAEQANAFASAKDLTDEQKRAQLVGLYVQLNALHPFPEGRAADHGRTRRLAELPAPDPSRRVDAVVAVLGLRP